MYIQGSIVSCMWLRWRIKRAWSQHGTFVGAQVMQQGWSTERKGYRVRAELPEDRQIMVSASPHASNKNIAKGCGKTEVLYFTFTFHRTGAIQFYNTRAAEESGSMMLSGSRKVPWQESKWVHGSFSFLVKCHHQSCVLELHLAQ